MAQETLAPPTRGVECSTVLVGLGNSPKGFLGVYPEIQRQFFVIRRREMGLHFYTHLNVDLDATASVWAARQFIPGYAEATVEFRPANWDGAEMAEGDLALDIPAGGKGWKGAKAADGIVSSCFCEILRRHASVEDQRALADVAAFVDAQDAHGSAVKWLAPGASPEAQTVLAATGLNAVLRAFQAIYPRNDALVCERMAEIFSGMLQAGRARVRAAAEANKAEVLGGKVAIVRDSREFATNAILFEERGVRVVVYTDRMNLGLIREGSETLRMDHPELRAVVEAAGETPEWFAHPAGFLYCRGSRKSPAESPSRVNPRTLAEIALRLLPS